MPSRPDRNEPPPRRAPSRAVVAAVLLLAAGACKPAPSTEAPSARESPQAKAEPAPFASVPTANAPSDAGAPDAGPPLVALRGDDPPPVDSAGRDVGGYVLVATLRTADPPAAPRWPEIAQAALDGARKELEPRLQIELGAHGSRVVLEHGAFVVPAGTEVRGRADRAGFVVILPSEGSYHVAAPGSLRALFNDRRLDVSPLSPADVTPRGDGGRRLGLRTRRIEVTNRVATASFEVARVNDAGDGGVVLCRALLDLMSAPPSTFVCATDEIPLRADLHWTTRGALTFEVTDLARRPELAPLAAILPPPGLPFALPALPAASSAVLVPPATLASLRNGPPDVPAPPGSRAASPPASGLALANGLDELRFVWLDGAPLAWVAPGARLALPTLPRGRYMMVFRSFLGDASDPSEVLFAPGEGGIGLADAGAASR